MFPCNVAFLLCTFLVVVFQCSAIRNTSVVKRRSAHVMHSYGSCSLMVFDWDYALCIIFITCCQHLLMYCVDVLC